MEPFSFTSEKGQRTALISNFSNSFFMTARFTYFKFCHQDQFPVFTRKGIFISVDEIYQ